MLLSTLTKLPDNPGIYQYFDHTGKLLYVGKAKSLKNRVKSYFRFIPEFKPNPTLSLRILKMLDEAKSLDYLVVESEEDALILENSLIKQLKPKYNILLRDDKTYPYLYIDENEPFARFELTRKVVSGKAITYYGPFPSGGKALYDAIYELYPLVQKKRCLHEKKACLFYQIGRCLAPCEGKITQQEYASIIQQVKEALRKRKKLTSALQQKMMDLAVQERFEEAAKMRDMMMAIDNLAITSDIDLAQNTDIDIFAILKADVRGVVVKFFVRSGRIASSTFSYFRHQNNFDPDEAYRQALLEFYTAGTPHIAKTILTAHPVKESAEIASALSKRLGYKIDILHPRRGAKVKLTALALQNCQELLKDDKANDGIEQEIASLFDLSAPPYRIETFDNSHLMGAATVGAMVVQDEGRWNKKSYRRYTLHEYDEYGQMREMLTRRIEDFGVAPAPDLWIIDGGQAHLALARKLLGAAQVNLDVIAIAKEKLDAKAHRAKGAAKDRIYCDKGILELKASDRRLGWIQKQRDEAHRFAVAFHQSKKRKDDLQVSLLDKKGIGKATVKKLIDYFGSFEAIDNASHDEIANVAGGKIASILKNVTYHPTNDLQSKRQTG